MGTKIRIHLADDHETNPAALLAALVIRSFFGASVEAIHLLGLMAVDVPEAF